MQITTARRRKLLLLSGFALLLAAVQILHLPQTLSFKTFAFGEPGANLNVVYLIHHGMHPNVDFGHPYGLLPFLFSDLWFRVAGLTPAAYWAGIFLIELAMCAALADFAVAAELGVLPILLLFVSFPIYIWVDYFNFAHAVEALCLMVAVTAHLKGRYGLALAAVGAAVLARPALGYVYGFVLVCIVMWKIFRAHSLRLSVFVLPACTAVCLGALLAWRFGVASLMRTAVPLTGVATYRALGFGFFSDGMAFWLPSPFRLRFYLDVPGFWLLVTGSLLLLGPIAIFRVRDAGSDNLKERKAEVLGAGCSIVFVWIFFAFSHQYIGSWILYLWLAVWGVSLLPDFFPKYATVLVLLGLIALNSDRHMIQGSLQEWASSKTSSIYPHTMSQGKDDQQMTEILSAVQGRRTGVLTVAGAMPLLHDGLGEPLTEFYVPGIVLPGDELRMKSAVAAADFVIVPTPPWYRADSEYFPWADFLDGRNNYRVILLNPSGFVLARKSPSADKPDAGKQPQSAP